jgi:hypothetical protein
MLFCMYSCHPDPNLTYAPELVERMGLPVASGSHGHGHAHGGEHKKPDGPVPDFGAAADGDAVILFII